MGHRKYKGMARYQSRPFSRRRGYIPEPCEVMTTSSEQVYQMGDHHEINYYNRKHSHRNTNKSSLNFTHTSCLMAIRNCVERMQNTKQRKKRVVSSRENAEKLLCSLKNDIQMISKFEEEAASNSGKPPTSDPFFVLSAMMCKINKLESILLSQPDCREQLARWRDMIMMAQCIKKSLLEQAQCDEQLLHEKQRKMICLVRSLEMFEKDIRCETRGLKKVCCPKEEIIEAQEVGINCSCIDKQKCVKECPGKAYIKENNQQRARSRSPSTMRLRSDPCNLSRDACTDPCLELCKKFDVTGLKVIYTKSHVKKDVFGSEKEQIKNQLNYEMNEDERCHITVIKDGASTSSNTCDPIIKEKMNNLSKLWMESARQLIDACPTD